MKILSIIGIVISLIGIIAGIYVMTEVKCESCGGSSYDYSFGGGGLSGGLNPYNSYSGSTTPGAASGGGLIMMLVSIFFMVFSIISTAISFSKRNNPDQAYPQSYPSYPPQYGQQQYPPQYSQQQQPPNPYQQNPYQNPYSNQPPNTPPGA